MDGNKYRILLFGDYSNCHNALAIGLRRLGHEVTVASNGTGWMQTPRDINLQRRLPGKAGGLTLWLDIMHRRRRALCGHDIVAINNPICAELRPERCRAVFDMLRQGNRSIFLTAMGTDTAYARECVNPASPLGYNEWRMFGAPTPLAMQREPDLRSWMQPPLSDVCNYIYDNIDGATTVLYEYDLALRRRLGDELTAYIGIPVDTRSVKLVEMEEQPEKVRIFLGRHRGRLAEKGTDILERAAREVVSRNSRISELVIVENRPYSEYLTLLESAHIVLDQLYSYSPATNAMLAMAMGKTVVSGGENAFYNFIGEHDNRPIVNVQPGDYPGLVRSLENLVKNRAGLRERGLRSREFVIAHNDADLVAARAIDFWTHRLALKQK